MSSRHLAVSSGRIASRMFSPMALRGFYGADLAEGGLMAGKPAEDLQQAPARSGTQRREQGIATCVVPTKGLAGSAGRLRGLRRSHDSSHDSLQAGLRADTTGTC